MIEASRKRNVIPGSCVIEVDCRLLPGQELAEMEALLRAGRARRVGARVDRLAEHVGGTRSALDTQLWRAAPTPWVDPTDPGARLAPVVCRRLHRQPLPAHPSRDDRLRLLSAARGMEVEIAASLVHSADERVAVDDLELGVDLFRHVATTLGA